jgi:hypothetical protein
VSLLTNPTSARKRDIRVFLGLRRLAREQPQQSCPRPLGDLAVLVRAPAVLATELETTRLARELACQHKPLIARELAREASDTAQVVAQEGQPLDIGASIAHVCPAICAADKGKRAGKCRLDRATPVQCTAAIVDAREEFLLERVGDMDSIGKFFSASGASQKLQRRLAVAVLQVLTPQPVSMRSEQQFATRASHECDCFVEIEPTQCVSTERSCARK